jgi:hypothetical protein
MFGNRHYNDAWQKKSIICQLAGILDFRLNLATWQKNSKWLKYVFFSFSSCLFVFCFFFFFLVEKLRDFSVGF